MTRNSPDSPCCRQPLVAVALARSSTIPSAVSISSAAVKPSKVLAGTSVAVQLLCLIATPGVSEGMGTPAISPPLNASCCLARAISTPSSAAASAISKSVRLVDSFKAVEAINIPAATKVNTTVVIPNTSTRPIPWSSRSIAAP